MSVTNISNKCKECDEPSKFTITISPNKNWSDPERTDLELCEDCLINYCKDIIENILIIRRIGI